MIVRQVRVEDTENLPSPGSHLPFIPTRQTLPMLSPELHREFPQHAGAGGPRQATLQAQSLLQVRP